MDRFKSVRRYTVYEGGPKDIELKDTARYINQFAEEVFAEAERISFGQSADVFRDPFNGCCYKLISRQTETLLNAEEEAAFLSELQGIESEVKVPLPLFSLEATVAEEGSGKLSRKSIICMERIEGPSIKDILSGTAAVPENFDFNTFFTVLKKFVQKMNDEYKIYHRDLHEGNIMIDASTGMPRIIDFGLSRKKILTDENPYETEVDIRQRVFTFNKDMDEVLRIESKLREYLEVSDTQKGILPTSPFGKESASFADTRALSIKEDSSFNTALEAAVAEMGDTVDAITIPGSLGLCLVKDDSPEFDKRKDTALILYPKHINQKRYFVCRK